MKRLVILITAAILFAGVAFAGPNDGTGTLTEHTFKHKGIEYTYYLYKPQNLPDGAPLIMAFHGYSSKHIKLLLRHRKTPVR